MSLLWLHPVLHGMSLVFLLVTLMRNGPPTGHRTDDAGDDHCAYCPARYTKEMYVKFAQ